MAVREDWGLTSRQIFLLTLALVGATEILTEPTSLARYAGQDAWLAPLLGLPIGVLPLLCWHALDRRFPWLTLTEQARTVAGPIIGGTLLLLPVLLRSITALGTAERQVSELVAGIALPRTPPVVASALLVLPVVLVVRMGPEVLARLAEVLVTGGFALLLLLAAVATRHAHPSSRLPIMARGWRPVLQGGLVSGGFDFPTVFLMYLLPFRGCTRRTALAAALGGLAAAGVLLSMTTAVCIMIFGGLTPMLNIAFLQVVRTVSLSEFLTHLDPVFLTVWEGFSFVKIGLYFYVTCLSLAQTLGLKDYRPLTLPVAAFTIIGSVTWFSSSVQAAQFATRALPFLGILLGLPSPMLVWAVAALRGMGRHGKQRSGPRQAAA